MKRIWFATKNAWKLVILLLLIALAFSYAMFQGGFVSWFLFYSFVPFALYALALSFYSFKDFQAVRNFPKTNFHSGETLKAAVTIQRSSSFPLFYMVAAEEFGETLAYEHRRKKTNALLFPHLQKEMMFDLWMENLPRGEHFFDAIRVKIGDPLGLIQKEAVIETTDRIVVYPSYEEMNYRLFENHFDQGMTASKERVQRDTSMAVGVREYQPGDRFSWINWKATAKRNDIMTKEFEQRQSHDVLVVMDCAPDQRFETVVSFTASLIMAILRKGAQAGLLTFSEERASFPISGGAVQQQQLFYHLAKIRDNSTVQLDRVIEKESFILQQDVGLIIVTAQLSRALIEKSGFFTRRNGVVTIFVVKHGKERPAKQERTLIQMAKARGVRVKVVHEGKFSEAFSEVNRE